MLGYVAEYESVRRKEHKEFKTARGLFKARGICFQNFYKFYRRYISAGRDEQALLPTRRGPKPRYKELPLADDSLEYKILAYRKLGFNKFIIAEALKRDKAIKKPCSASTVYRILKRYGESQLKKAMIVEKRRIIREHPGSLGHLDCHTLPKGIVRTEPGRRYYVVGCIDDYSRVCWVEVTESLKALDVCFAMMDIILIMSQRYDIRFDEVLTDNGAEFCSSDAKKMGHPFERLLIHFGIKHRKTRPYTPQTNGKIERFWKTFDDEVIEGAEYNSLEELKDAIVGYNFYYNEHRPHQSLNGKVPALMLDVVLNEGVKSI
jgi:transposase InsO family protein